MQTHAKRSTKKKWEAVRPELNPAKKKKKTLAFSEFINMQGKANKSDA